MPKFFTLNLSKRNSKSKPTIRISNEECIPQRREQVQLIGLFEERWQAELALKVKGAKALRTLWGKEAYLEYVNGTIHYSTLARRRLFFARFVR